MCNRHPKRDLIRGVRRRVAAAEVAPPTFSLRLVAARAAFLAVSWRVWSTRAELPSRRASLRRALARTACGIWFVKALAACFGSSTLGAMPFAERRHPFFPSLRVPWGTVDGTKEEAKDDKNLRTMNVYSLAIAEIQRTAINGRATRVYRLGEYVPFLAVNRSGGAKGAKQLENVASPAEVILHGTPVDLKLLYHNRLIPALLGQVREASGAATKSAAEHDRRASRESLET